MWKGNCLKSLLFRTPGNFPFMVAFRWVLFQSRESTCRTETEDLVQQEKHAIVFDGIIVSTIIRDWGIILLFWNERDSALLVFLSKQHQLWMKYLFSLSLSVMWSIHLQFTLHLESGWHQLFLFVCSLGQQTGQLGTVNQHLFVRIQILLCPDDGTNHYWRRLCCVSGPVHLPLALYPQKSTCIHAPSKSMKLPAYSIGVQSKKHRCVWCAHAWSCSVWNNLWPNHNPWFMLITTEKHKLSE